MLERDWLAEFIVGEDVFEEADKEMVLLLVAGDPDGM